jgi:hypothetical protein
VKSSKTTATPAAGVRFSPIQALRAFLEPDTRPVRTQLLQQLSHPVLTEIRRPDLHQLTQRPSPRNERRPSASAISGAVARASLAPRRRLSHRSATANASC